jgi:hypothetical protein
MQVFRRAHGATWETNLIHLRSSVGLCEGLRRDPPCAPQYRCSTFAIHAVRPFWKQMGFPLTTPTTHRGHLTFFRNTPQAAEKITAHPDFTTKEGWLSMRNFHHKLGELSRFPLRFTAELHGAI